VTYDSLTNRGDYLSPYYLAEKLPAAIREKGGLRARWAAGESPVKALRALRQDYFGTRLILANPDEDDDLKAKAIKDQNEDVLRSLGYPPSDGQPLRVVRAGETYEIPVAYAARSVVALNCRWAADVDEAFNPVGGGRLLEPVQISTVEIIETGVRLARWLFAVDEPPRYVLLVHGGVIVLADRLTWGEGRYLAVSLDVALERARADEAELELIAALFSADALQPPAEGGTEPLAAFVAGSRQHAVGVSTELREGLRESVQIIANEVLERIRGHGVRPQDTEPDLAKELGRQSLRYLYRILFLLYAEARPELHILPADDEDYVAGYSMARLGELVTRRLGGDESRQGLHLHESLDLLFRMVNEGHNPRGASFIAEDASEGAGLRFEALKADLFDPARTRLIGESVEVVGAEDERFIDTRLRDEALYHVLRRLMLSKGRGRGHGGSRRGRTERGGFISYAQLGINQLGAVYEGLMSYTGFIAAEELYEVAKNGDPSGGSWMIPASRVDGYADDVFVRVVDENGVKTAERVRYRAGSFVYRLAGRDRQTSASYYTPQSLTSVTVQLALEQREKEEGRTVSAAEVLRWRVCEPALGSGAFLNEAIDQLAALYLRKREAELGGNRLEPDQRALELQRVKAYIALHNCYGVDLNETAVELAEVSIWLNVMHQGLQAPWFGLHLVRGNSLIGCGRRLYPAASLADKSWLKTAPEDVPFSSGAVPAGHVHHFLLPAAGWGAVASEKEAKQLAPTETAALAAWRKKIQAAPSARRTQAHKLSQVARLQALAGRAEYLWHLVVERLRISEREISRAIDVWGADDLPEAVEAIPRAKIVHDLQAPGTPYWRLKTLMDAWCALWFWPVDKATLLDGSAPVYAAKTRLEMAVAAQAQPTAEPEPVDPDPAGFPPTWEKVSLFGESPTQLQLAPAAPRKPKPARLPVDLQRPVPLASLDDWLDFAEALLGRKDIEEHALGEQWNGSLKELSSYEDKLDDPLYMYMDKWGDLPERFPWLATVEDIAKDQGFFHWELRFASVFKDGGFDVQVGNPPWVRPIWDENAVLAEFDPWFELAEKPPVPVRNARMAELLMLPRPQSFYLEELTGQAGLETFTANIATYDLLVGTQPDLYRAMMIRTWRSVGRSGTVGLLHPDTHLIGDAERYLRAEAFRRLRLHGDYANKSNRFFPEPVSRNVNFGMHIYASPQPIGFLHVSWLLDASELPKSLALAEAGKLPDGWGHRDGRPGVKFRGDWDARPHPDRVIQVNADLLATWRLISGGEDQPIEYTKLLNPVTSAEQQAIVALGRIRNRVGDLQPRISRGYDEAGAKKEGIIRSEVNQPASWSDVILKGSQFWVSTPFFRQISNNESKGDLLDLRKLPGDARPNSEYVRAVDVATYRARQDVWVDHGSLGGEGLRPYTEFYRVMWREMIPQANERSLFAAIYPPGPAHIHGVRSMAMSCNRDTVLVAGFLAGLPLDYLLRVTKTEHLDVKNIRSMPAPARDHPLAVPLLLRTLRLNCLTSAYARLWSELYDDSWSDECWAVNWPQIAPIGDVRPEWEENSPFRIEYERRAGLVEIDALIAVWLGITEEQLEAIYSARFPVLADYDAITWFDSTGRKIARNWNTFGTDQTKEHWRQFERYLEDPATTPAPDGYTPPFYKANRIAEYRQAHAVFTERLARA
jgi:hypothetical protein